ncbi:MAG TPA: hypothetical protein VFQ58_04190, partial [Flavisolibacter sp.]|nr:hypothetical protein [Flavisolibacter sp.]
MKKLLLLLLLITGYFGKAQEIINIDGVDCDLHGSSKPGSKTYYLNGFKNRFNYPTSNDLDSTITFNTIMHSGDPNQFSQDKALKLSGYVFNVKTGGVETCNCRTKDPQYRDTHIELT